MRNIFLSVFSLAIFNIPIRMNRGQLNRPRKPNGVSASQIILSNIHTFIRNIPIVNTGVFIFQLDLNSKLNILLPSLNV